jgi:esterase/lipase superfamily enzyme
MITVAHHNHFVRPDRAGLLLGAFLLLSLSSGAFAAQYDLCARGVADEFTRTVRVRLSVDGPELGERLSTVAAQLVKRLVFKGRASEVYVEPFDETLCSAALGERHDIAISLTQAELDELSVERGGAVEDQAAVSAAAARASVTQYLAPAGTPGKGVDLVIRIFYATDRLDTGKADPNERFGGERDEERVSFGAALVTVPKSHEMGELETPSIWRLEFREDSEKHLRLQVLRPLGLEAWRGELRERAAKFERPGVLLFIHGYNVTFADAAKRTAQLACDLAFPGPAVFFSWPSRAQTLAYPADRQTAEWAAPHLKLVLAELSALGPGVPVYVVAHSMGNQVFTYAFKDLLAEAPGRHRQFSQIVLAAPDVDAAIFKRDIAPRILGLEPRVTLYASSNDSALVQSRKFQHSTRLGEGGKRMTVLAGMDSIDASSVKTDFLGHSYYGDSSTLLSDLFYLIRKRLPPSERFGLAPVSSPSGTYWRFAPRK